MEIERKWLFDMEKVPIELSKTITTYFQGYISVEPEVRIRRKHVRRSLLTIDNEPTYALCIKGNGTLSRIEIQRDITKEEFNQLLEVGNMKTEDLIHKVYYTIPIDKYKLTVGTVDCNLDSTFSYGEIEFESEEEALAFNPPDWFGKEVTDDPAYKMKNYWKRTRLHE